MDRTVCQRRYQEALSNAFAARALNVRLAYLDLANYYRKELGDKALV